MQIEAGKYYKTRDGRKVGPMFDNGSDNELFVWTDGNGGCWAHNGEDGNSFGRIGTPTPGDCVAGFIDVYTIPTMPFGLLTPEQQKALRDLPSGEVEGFTGDGWAVCAVPSWHHVSTYRAKPKPNREMFITPRGCIASNGLMDGARRVTITYDTVDGVIDAATYRVVPR